MQEKIFETLESVGLQRNEITVYLDLIKTGGNSSAHDIANRTKIHRSNVYDILNKLTKKGIVTQSVENNVKKFYPVSPQNLLNYFKQKEYDLKKIIPEIEKAQNRPQEQRRVIMLEGIKAFRMKLNDLLEKNKPLYVYGIPKDVSEVIGGFIEDFHERRIKMKIPMKHIYNKDAQKRIKFLNKLEYTEARYFPSDYNSSISTLICGDTVLLIFWETPVFTIAIENLPIAEAYRNYFDILWREAIPDSSNF